MKRAIAIALLSVATAGIAAAQVTAPSANGVPTSDVLGAHLNYGRGCVGCHAPHAGAAANGTVSKTATGVAPVGTNPNRGGGDFALWGEDTSGLEGVTLTFGDGNKYTVALPALASGDPRASGILLCLSCHDGNLAQGSMMQNKTYEGVTIGSQTITPPTLLGADGGYQNDHPVGENAIYTCNGAASQYAWNCTWTTSRGNMTITPNDTAGQNFQADYGFYVKFASYTPSGSTTAQAIVLCTTCHNQHVMSVVKRSGANGTALPGGTNNFYSTMFFLVGPYNPNRGGESNEMNNAIGTNSLPTII